MKKELDYEKKIKICKLLGADIFKDIVLQAERIKYKVIKKFFPNYIKNVDKYIDKKKQKLLRNAKTEEEKKNIKENARRQKLAARKEINWEQNRNYHIDSNRPTEVLEYLNYNKKIHTSGMIFNIGALIFLATLVTTKIIPSIALTLMLGEATSLFINFQCVNLQNLNIYRIKNNEEKIKRIENKTNERNIRKYSKGAEAIGRALQSTNDIPTAEQVVEKIESKEEIEQLLNMIRATRIAKGRAEQQNHSIDNSSKELFSMFETQKSEEKAIEYRKR